MISRSTVECVLMLFITVLSIILIVDTMDLFIRHLQEFIGFLYKNIRIIIETYYFNF